VRVFDWKRGLGVFLLYLALALLITFPAVLTPTTRLMGGDTSDAYEMARHIWWFKEALQSGQSPFWQSNLGYPEGFSGVSLQADTLQFFPMWLFAFIMPLALAYNLGLWLTMALNGLALTVLARDRTGSHWGAFLGGVIFLAAPIMQGHLFEGHAGLLVQWPVPLYLLGLFRLVESETFSWRWLLWCIVFFQLVPSGHMLQVIYLLMPVTGLFLLARLWIKDRRGAARIILMGAISSVLLLLFLQPLIRETLAADNYTDTGGTVRYSADLLAIVSPSFLHPLYKYLPYPAHVLGVNLGEGALYMGLIAGLLALVGLRNKTARWWGIVAFVAWILALGPLLKVLDTPLLLSIGEYRTHITLPLALVQNWPGFSLARTPGRYGFALSFALAMLAAYGAGTLWRRWNGAPRRALIACGMVTLLIVADYQVFFPLPTRPAAIPQAVYDLHQDARVRAVYDIPYEHLLGAKDALYLQTAHGKPLIAGQVTRSTPVNPAKLELLQYTLDPALLKAYGADVIILHKTRAAQIKQLETLNALLRVKFPPPFYEDSEIAMYHTPDYTLTPAFTARLPEEGAFRDETHAAFYTPRPGWMMFEATLTGDGRRVNVFLDHQRLRTLTVNGTQRLMLPLPIAAEGFYTVRLTLDPACPQIDDSALACRTMSISDVHLTSLNRPFAYSLIRFAPGVTLNTTEIIPQGKTLLVYLDWQFAQGVRAEDVRFVHVLSADGTNAAQQDVPLGAFPPDSRYPEAVQLDISTLPPGRYSVRVGWYASETGMRFPVQTPDLVGGVDNAPEIGTFTEKAP